MDLNQGLDIYCERTNSSFWAEPINAFSNISFIIAAILALKLYSLYIRNGVKKDIHIYVLIILAFIVGIGSFIFHTFATVWAQFVDVIPIFVFAFYFFTFTIWKIVKFNRLQAGISFTLFFILFIIIIILVPSGSFNGSIMYLPFLITLGTISIYLNYKKYKAANYFYGATGLLFLALIFRTIDLICCPYIPIGTHFLWHIINGVMVYVLLRISIISQVKEKEYLS